ncbi:MDR family MFS transporter [Pseudoclavibacter helvolus]|uniref:EmrB/QacA subfamily drug resistance transporter n=1 Tax=Pseudoclavibacter helvolus TaxID=255205 RepID=A0A7W4UNQ1_9MICO|nr:MDR family MFS transporter [Pseudoclavibacter helvolus]MBB2957758.1 EmrB/QacA subfamily drug resistance transporter [Pseudoclavibacter helvolus]
MTTPPSIDSQARTDAATTAEATTTPDAGAVKPAAVADAAGAHKRSIVPLFLGLMVTMLMASLNNTVLSSAMPTIVGELHGVEHMSWVVTSFILASTVMMPVYGNLSDLFGRKPLLLIAIGLFIAGSVLGGLAPSIELLIGARIVQGLGGGGLMILSQAAIADVVPARERGKYMGVMGAVFAFSSVAGPLLGGWFTEGPGWRWVFWINLPLGALALLATIFLLRLPKRPAHERTRIDVGGMALISLATTALVLVGTWGGSQYEWTSPTILLLAALAVVSATGFVFVERSAANPIMPLGMFRDRNFILTTIASLSTGVIMFGTLGYMPTYLQMVTGSGPTVSGLLMTPMMGALLITSILSGQYVSRTGRYKWVPIAGSAVLGVGLGVLSFVTVDSPVWLICVALGVMGIGLGGSMQLLTLIVQNSFPARIVGTATAANNYFRQVGATLGSAVVGSVFAARLTQMVADRLPAGAAAEDGASSFTPAAIAELPDQLRAIIVGSYNEALIPIFLALVPLTIISIIALSFLREKPLATGSEPATTTSATHIG